jgi:hypothetical protein
VSTSICRSRHSGSSAARTSMHNPTQSRQMKTRAPATAVGGRPAGSSTEPQNEHAFG